MPVLFTLGHGYVADVVARRLRAEGWRVMGTARRAERAAQMRAAGIEVVEWPGDPGPALGRASHVLVSAAPQTGGDPFFEAFGAEIRRARPQWLGYLSTTAVYGDRQGGWVDEETPPAPQSARAVQRVLAERQWLESGLPAHVFRLAGIYGPGRGPFAKLREGVARRIVKPGQVFSRIHVEDIATTLIASMARPDPGRIYNVCDDDPAPPEDVLDFAARLLGLPVPPAEDHDAADMSAMARSFYAESKRVRNTRIKDELGVRLLYPTYREGLSALRDAGG